MTLSKLKDRRMEKRDAWKVLSMKWYSHSILIYLGLLFLMRLDKSLYGYTSLEGGYNHKNEIMQQV